MVRTPGFHPGNRGSIPLGATKKAIFIPRMAFLFLELALLPTGTPKRDTLAGSKTALDHQVCRTRD